MKKSLFYFSSLANLSLTLVINLSLSLSRIQPSRKKYYYLLETNGMICSLLASFTPAEPTYYVHECMNVWLLA